MAADAPQSHRSWAGTRAEKMGVGSVSGCSAGVSGAGGGPTSARDSSAGDSSAGGGCGSAGDSSAGGGRPARGLLCGLGSGPLGVSVGLDGSSKQGKCGVAGADIGRFEGGGSMT